MIGEHPLLGTGLGTWSYILCAFPPRSEWSTTGYYAHNDYLQLAAEGGLLTLVLLFAGLILIAGLFLRLARQGRMSQTRLRRRAC